MRYMIRQATEAMIKYYPSDENIYTWNNPIKSVTEIKHFHLLPIKVLGDTKTMEDL